jgi:hypothetical protein
MVADVDSFSLFGNHAIYSDSTGNTGTSKLVTLRTSEEAGLFRCHELGPALPAVNPDVFQDRLGCPDEGSFAHFGL